MIVKKALIFMVGALSFIIEAVSERRNLMNTKVVLFGNANHGKSTIIGYLYAKSYHIDLKN